MQPPRWGTRGWSPSLKWMSSWPQRRMRPQVLTQATDVWSRDFLLVLACPEPKHVFIIYLLKLLMIKQLTMIFSCLCHLHTHTRHTHTHVLYVYTYIYIYINNLVWLYLIDLIDLIYLSIYLSTYLSIYIYIYIDIIYIYIYLSLSLFLYIYIYHLIYPVY